MFWNDLVFRHQSYVSDQGRIGPIGHHNTKHKTQIGHQNPTQFRRSSHNTARVVVGLKLQLYSYKTQKRPQFFVLLMLMV